MSIFPIILHFFFDNIDDSQYLKTTGCITLILTIYRRNARCSSY